jgi:hypothetical protein
VRGVSKMLDPSEASKELFSIMERTYPGKLIKLRVLGNY